MFPREWPLERRLQALQDAGFHGVELTIGGDLLPQGSDAGEARKLREKVKSYGLEISALRGGPIRELNSGDRKVRAEAIKALDWFFPTVRELGSDAVLAIVGAISEDVPHDKAMEIAREVVGEILPLAERHGVHLCLEPVWPPFGASFLNPLPLRDFIDGFGSDYLNCYFDVANVLISGFPQHWIRILGKRIYRVHAKDFRADVRAFTYLLHGDVPWKQVMAALREVGYDGWMTFECERVPLRADPEEGIRQTSRALDLIFAM